MDRRPLRGIRVFELGLAVAAPVCTRYMAHFGAEVVKVESARQPDVSRSIGPGWIPRDRYGDQVWLDLAVVPNELCAGKLDVSIDLRSPQGMGAAQRILVQCDVFVSNYSAEALASLGLDYESVRKVKPDIIHLALSGFGSTPDTPYYNYVALGSNLTSLCGLDDLTGAPDGRLVGISNVAYCDWTNAMLGLIAVLSALEHRSRTGEGQAIDLSQYEGAVGLLGPALLDYDINGREPDRNANRVAWAAPQGVYRCRGNDRWAAITVSTEAEWQSFCRVAGHVEWIADLRFQALEDRLAHHDELDAVVGDWTAQHAASEVVEWLQRVGVAAYVVVSHADLVTDSQLAARDFWLLTEHARWGEDVVSGNPIRLDATPGHVERAAPSIGQDNEYVLGELCGFSEAEINDMVAAGAVFPMGHPELKLERRYFSWIRHFMPQLPWPAPAKPTS